MRAIKSRDTKPEVLVRSMLHRAGYRFTVNGPLNKKLPGKPDIVLPKYKTVIFVHGCFWHRHKNCKGTTTPKTRTEWWQAKFDRNVSNDRKNVVDPAGWQCEPILRSLHSKRYRYGWKYEPVLRLVKTHHFSGL